MHVCLCITVYRLKPRLAHDINQSIFESHLLHERKLNCFVRCTGWIDWSEANVVVAGLNNKYIVN